MDPARKYAYRRLLYYTTLHLRILTQDVSTFSNAPWKWPRIHQSRTLAWEVSNWIHNLALFASLDFDHFEEDRFWAEHDQLFHKYPVFACEQYPLIFERELKSFDPSPSAVPPGAIPPISPNEKYAYRMLLHEATVILHQTISPNLTWRFWQWPALLRHQHLPGDVSLWVQSLSQASANDFQNFNDEEFWRLYTQLALHFPPIRALAINFKRRL